MAELDDERVQPALLAMLESDAAGLQAAIARDPEIVSISWGENTLLEWVTQPPHGAAPEVIDVLIANGSALDRALNLAGCWNLANLCQRLIVAGADPSARADAGITPLESAAMHGATGSADVLVGHGLHRPSLWLAAASGLRDRVAEWVSPDGSILLPIGSYRPNWAAVGHPEGSPPTDDPAEIVGEALVFAGANGRSQVVDYLLAAGVDINARPYRNTTALHFAILFRNPRAVAHLLACGAATNIADDRYESNASGWAAACSGDDPESQRIVELLAAS